MLTVIVTDVSTTKTEITIKVTWLWWWLPLKFVSRLLGAIFFFLHGNKTGIRERVRWVHLARSGSQSELAYLSYMYVIPAWGVFHSEPADIWLVLFWVSVSQIFFRWLDSDRTNCSQKHHVINANGQREKLQNDK